MAEVFASTTNYFTTLPTELRQVALDVQRNMGGSRFFVSFNPHKLNITTIPDSLAKKQAIHTIKKSLMKSLNHAHQIDVDFSMPDSLKVLNEDLVLSDLPNSWAHHTLNILPVSPEVLVVQIEIEPKQWIYIASPLPAPYTSLNASIINADQLVFLIAITTLLLVFSFNLIKHQTKPLKHLADAANRLSTDIEQPQLIEEGASEISTVTRAFNLMQKRLQRYMRDREKLFSSISHDLKTPITRLRLRAALIDDDIQSEKMNQDLDELEIMVKGALQTVKDTDIHENIEQIDIYALLESIAEIHNQYSTNVRIHGDNSVLFWCKPLAMKRCLTNLINNGVKYGKGVEIHLYNTQRSLDITILDHGPGIPENHLERVFEPYFRLHNDHLGHGLGLGISKNIVHGHGGEIFLSNRNEGGLQIDIAFPKA